MTTDPNCPAPQLFNKPMPGTSDGTTAFYWQDPACGRFYLRGTQNPDPATAPDEEFEILQPTIYSRQATESPSKPGMWILGPVFKSVIIAPDAPWTGVELYGPQ